MAEIKEGRILLSARKVHEKGVTIETQEKAEEKTKKEEKGETNEF